MKNFKLILSEVRSTRTPDRSLSPYLVSTRLPKGDAPTGPEKLTVGMNNYGEKEFPKLAKLLTTPVRMVKGNPVQVYPNIGPEILKLTDPKQVLDATRRHMERNLEWGIERAKSLPELAERSQQWYVGAHNIAKRFGERFGVPHHVAAAVLASQSPQRDWYQNVSLGERIMHIHKNHQNTGWSPEMEAITKKVFKPEDPEHKRILSSIRGKSLGELTDPLHKAGWIRTYDEAHHPRHHRLITPEGEFAEHATNENGKRTGTSWGDFKTIAKGVIAMESGGDMKKISASVGKQHKVRSFYNNIIQPNTPKIISPAGEDPRDVTVDTHAAGNVFARPSLAGHDPEVTDVLGGSPQSIVTGMAGTYPLAADAFRNVADERGLFPNAVQSIVWDGKRAQATTEAQMREIDALWMRHQAGDISHEDVLRAKSKILGPAKIASWSHTKGNPLFTSTFESVKQRASRLISESLRRRYK